MILNANIYGSGGGGDVNPTAEENDVIFIDYDGTIRYSYSASEFANLSSLPENPTHEGLTAQGWNWTLADAKTYVANYGGLVIGQMYITTSGATEIDIELYEGRLSPWLTINPNGTVNVDWGDNSSYTSVTGTSLGALKSVQHTYENPGKYTIKLIVQEGRFAISGANSSNGTRLISANTTSSSSPNKAYQNSIKAVRFGENVELWSFGLGQAMSLKSVTLPMNIIITSSTAEFMNCISLQSMTFPMGVISLDASCMSSCSSLSMLSLPMGLTTISNTAFSNTMVRRVTFPEGMTELAQSVLYNAYGLQDVTIPNSVTSLGASCFSGIKTISEISLPRGLTTIGANAFASVASLTHLIIPDSVTSIGASVMQNCAGLKDVSILSVAPPTLGSTAFTSTSNDIVIYVPPESVDAYKEATNWSAWASKIQAMPG